MLEKAIEMMKHGYVCDHCIGRQFAQLLTGTNNEERGRNIRYVLAMMYDSGLIDVDPSNFDGIQLRNRRGEKKKECYVCKNIFERLEKVASKIEKKLKKIEFETFLVGTRLSSELLEREEKLWDRIGIEHCEPLKAELNREIGKILEKKMGKKVDLKMPDVSILYDVENDDVEISIRSLFIYGEYQKLKRGIPQTKWPSGKYKTSVEQIIAKPVMKITRGEGHKFHGYGREDIDALCIGWRPFILEIVSPKKRKIDLKSIQEEINKDQRVKVRGLRWSSSDEVVKVKESRGRKEYKCVVVCKDPVDKSDLKKLKSLETTIIQRTPLRVSHRRSDLVRKRKVHVVRAKYISPKKFELKVLADSGTYIKELVSGDGGRTRPSVSEILGTECECKDLVVTKIEKRF